MINTKTHFRTSQVKNKKTSFNQNKLLSQDNSFKSSVFNSSSTNSKNEKPLNQKKYLQSKAIETAEFILNQGRVPTFIINLMYSMFYRYKDVTIRQKVIADLGESCRQYVCEKISYLEFTRFIIKINNGLKVCDRFNGVYVKNPNSYKINPELNEKLEFIGRNLPKDSPLIQQLLSKFPSFRPILWGFLTIFSLSMNNNSLLSNYKSAEYQNYHSKETVSRYFEKTLEKECNLPTRSLSMTQVSKNYQKRENQSLDLRFVTESIYQTLNPEQKVIANRYNNAKKRGISIEKYDEHLKNINQSDKIWSPNLAKCVPLGSMQVEIIKMFDQQVILKLKETLRQYPIYKTDFNWIINYCLTLLRQGYEEQATDRNMSNTIRDILKKNGFHYQHIPPSTAYTRRGYKYKPFEPARNTIAPANEKTLLKTQDKDMETKRNKFLRFIGGETAAWLVDRAHK